MSFVNRFVRAEIGSEDVFLLGEYIAETQFGIENHHFMLVSFVVSVFHKVRLHHIAKLTTLELQSASIWILNNVKACFSIELLFN